MAWVARFANRPHLLEEGEEKSWVSARAQSVTRAPMPVHVLASACHAFLYSHLAMATSGPQYPISPRVLHAYVLWTGMQRNLFVTLPRPVSTPHRKCVTRIEGPRDARRIQPQHGLQHERRVDVRGERRMGAHEEQLETGRLEMARQGTSPWGAEHRKDGRRCPHLHCAEYRKPVPFIERNILRVAGFKIGRQVVTVAWEQGMAH